MSVQHQTVTNKVRRMTVAGISLLLFSGTMLSQYTFKAAALRLVEQNRGSGSGGDNFFELENSSSVVFLTSCEQPNCVCLVREQTTVTIPCGKFERAPGISFTYYMKASQQILVNRTMDYPQFLVSWNDSGTTLCCTPNTSRSDFLRDTTCYQLNVTYAPRYVDTEMTSGSSKWPIYGEPLVRVCPLESNPPAHYSWKRYSILDHTELNISLDVKFSRNGRQLEIAAYWPDHHNGVYVCQAANSLGTRESSSFYLHTEFCSRFKTRNISKAISPSGNLHYKPGDTVVLNCSFYPVQEIGQKPHWFFIKYSDEVNGSNAVVRYVDFNGTRQQYYYDKTTCIWKNTLTISNFSEDLSGTYSCDYSTHAINQTLKILAQEGISLIVKPPRRPPDWKFIVPLLLVAMVIVTVGVLVPIVLCVRCKMRHLAYSASKEPPSTGFLFDVFISAHDEVRGIVQHKLLQLLEKRSPPYKVCWHLRDFIVGVPINEQITNSIQQSRKIIFVFSEHFVESQFCCSELNQALDRFQLTRTRCILPIVLDEETVPKKVKSMLTYWPLVNLNDSNVLERITRILGDPMDRSTVEVTEHDPLLNC